jgi:Xaa-Pro aminopeptidase
MTAESCEYECDLIVHFIGCESIRRCSMRNALIVIVAFLVVSSPLLKAQDYQTHFPPEEFKARWERVFDTIGNKAIAILPGASDPGGYIYPRQSNVFYYLCGVENPYSYLLLDAKNRKVTLFLGRGIGSGDRVLAVNKPEIVKGLTGVDEVLGTDKGELTAQLSSMLRGRGESAISQIYTLFSPAEYEGQTRGDLQSRDGRIVNDPWDGRVSREAGFISLLIARYPRAEIRDLTPIIDEMRSIKSPREIELLRRAGQLSALGVYEAMRSTRLGLYEYQLEAVARYIFAVNGARLEGYRAILPAGVQNTADMHYFSNSSLLKDGDLVLMDYAPEYQYYTSDIGRMWPVNGKFNDWQRQICQFILDYEKAIIQRIRPGLLARDIRADAAKAMEEVFGKTKFLKPEYEKAARNLVQTGGGVFSHTVGMAVHDDAAYASAPLKPGQVFAIDPQLRVPEENLYMRVEDTVVVTEDGVEVLTRFAPKELDEIEKLIREGGGMVQKFPPTPPAKK